MIGKLKGLIDEIGLDYCIIDVQGVGYLVHASSKTLQVLPKEGEATTLIIETHVREDHINLYGFISSEEKEWFGILTTVKGVGTRMAMAVLSTFAPSELLNILASQDKAALIRINGVGPKLALRILTELEDKTGTILPQSTQTGVNLSQSAQANTKITDAVSALTNLGYSRSEAFLSVSTLSADNSDLSVEDLIRRSLKSF